MKTPTASTAPRPHKHWRPILLVAGALCFLPAIAQDAPEPEHDATEGMRTSFGVKGGANWSNLWVKEVDVESKDGRLGMHLGLFARFASPKSLGFQIEALYDQKGTTIRQVNNQIDQEITYKFDYIDAPLLMVIPLGEVMELHAGGYLGYMILSEVRRSGDLGEGQSDPQDSEFNGFDYGLVGGLGLNLGMAQIGARYNHGLADITENDVSKHVLGSSQNATGQIYLAIALGKQ